MMYFFKSFKHYTKKPNNISCGNLYYKEILIPFSPEPKRILRVWLPEDYDGKKRFPVFYFADGQNMVDKYTTAYGEWDLDDHIHEFIESGHSGIILVGIDCPYSPKVRSAEYMPLLNEEKLLSLKYPPYADLMADYFVNEIKPLIDSTFLTLKGKEYTGFGGSSMGGLFSFFICNKYPSVFGMCLSFSPAFLYYKNNTVDAYIESIKDNDVRIAFYTGCKDKLEQRIYKETIKWHKKLLSAGFNENNVQLVIDKGREHNEASWSMYFLSALEFLVKN